MSDTNLRRFGIFRAFLHALAGLFFLLFSTAGRADEEYPKRLITLVVPYSAGTGVDVLSRAVARKMSDRLGRAIVVENRAGASGNIGIRQVAKSAPDGYTLLTVLNTFTLNPAISASGYDAVADFSPIGMMASSGMVLVVNPSVAANTVPELVSLLKREPGKYFYASPGIGSPQHMSMELFKRAFNVDTVHVPHRSAAEANIGLLGGQTNLMFMPINIALQPIRAGKIRALAMSGAKQDPNLPGVKTVSELGAPGFDVGLWYAMIAPAGTPQSIVDKLSKHLADIIKDPEITAVMSALGMEADYVAPAQFTKFVQGELVRWKNIAQSANIKAD